MMPSPASAPDQHPDAEGPLPWPGLGAFTEQSRSVFFGRDRETAIIAQRVTERRLTVLHGPVGSGKTSLLGAGLVPLLREQGLRPLFVRLDCEAGGAPFADQLKGLLAELAAAPEAGAAQWMKRWEKLSPAEILDDPGLLPPDWQAVRRVLILDQFEEAFPFGRAGARRNDTEALFAALADFTAQPPPAGQLPRRRRRAAGDEPAVVHVLLSVRGDFLGRLDVWRKILPALTEERMELLPLTGPQAVEVITGPRGADGEPLAERAAAEQIVRLVCGCAEDADVSEITTVPPLVSLVCRELSAASPDGRILAEAVHHRSPAILHGFYQESFAGLPPAVQAYVEENLVSDAGRRESVPRSAMESALDESGVPAAAAVIDRLIGRRLLLVRVSEGVTRLELTHDRLVEVVEPGHRVRSEAAAREAAEAEKQRADEERRARRARCLRLAFTAAIVLMPLSAVRIWANGALNAERSGRFRDAAAAQAMLEGERLRSSALAAKLRDTARSDYRKALELGTGLTSREALPYLARAMESDPEFAEPAKKAALLLAEYPWAIPCSSVDPPGGGVKDVIFSPDGDTALVILAGEEATLWEPRTGRMLVSFTGHDGDITAAAFDPSGQHIITASLDRTVRIWNVSDGRELTRTGTDDEIYTDLNFSADGKRYCAIEYSGDASVRETASGTLLCSIGNDVPDFRYAALNDDGSEIVTGDKERELCFRRVADGSVRMKMERAFTGDRVQYLPGGKEISVDHREVTADHRYTGDTDSCIFDASTGTMVVSIQGKTIISADGANAATLPDNGSIRTWNRETLRRTAEFPRWAEGRGPRAISLDGTVVWTDAEVWLDGAAAVMAVEETPGPANPARRWYPRTSRSSRFFALSGPGSTVSFYYCEPQPAPLYGPLHARYPERNIGKEFSSEPLLIINDISTGKRISVPAARGNWGNWGNALSHHGRYFVSHLWHSSEKVSEVWDLDPSPPVRLFEVTGSDVRFSADDRYVISSIIKHGSSEEVEVWEIATRSLVGRLAQFTHACSFLPENPEIGRPDWLGDYFRIAARWEISGDGELVRQPPQRWLAEYTRLRPLIAQDPTEWGRFIRTITGIPPAEAQ